MAELAVSVYVSAHLVDMPSHHHLIYNTHYRLTCAIGIACQARPPEPSTAPARLGWSNHFQYDRTEPLGSPPSPPGRPAATTAAAASDVSHAQPYRSDNTAVTAADGGRNSRHEGAAVRVLKGSHHLQHEAADELGVFLDCLARRRHPHVCEHLQEIPLALVSPSNVETIKINVIAQETETEAEAATEAETPAHTRAC